MIRKTILQLILLLCCIVCGAKTANVIIEKNPSSRERYASEYLQRKLSLSGYDVTISDKRKKSDLVIYLQQAKDTVGLKKEGYTQTK